jgi:transmembrane protein TMEM260 (protein O-mannosyltransferase)
MRWTRAGMESLAAAAIAAIVYGVTLAPTVGAGDSGELVLAADSLGIAHPPGYPLWVLFARLMAMVPIGDLAWRVNALSALLSAAAVGLFYLLATRVALPRLAAALATSLFAWSTIVWHSAVEAEVYPLATLFFVLLALLALRARSGDGPAPRIEALYFFVAGLSLLVHQTLLFPAVALGAWVWAPNPRLGRLARHAGWAALGFSILLVIPVRAASNPPFSWDHEAGLSTALDHLLRRNYGPLQQNPLRGDLLASDLAGMAARAAAALGVAGAFLAAAGLRYFRSSDRGFSVVLFSALTVPAALATVVAFAPDAEHFAQVTPFLAPLVAALCLTAGLGADSLLRRCRAGWRPAAIASLAACVLAGAAWHYRECDRSGLRLGERYGRDLLRDLPARSTLVLDGDNETFLAAYASRHARFRTDVELVHRRGYIFGDPYRLGGVARGKWTEIAHRVDLERLKRSNRPVYYATPPLDLEAAGVRFLSAGLVHRAVLPGRGEPGPSAQSRASTQPAAAWTPPPDWPRSSALLPGGPRRYDYVTRKLAVGYSDAAARSLWNQGRLEEAYPWFVDAAAVGFDNLGARLNLATAAAAVGNPDQALSELLAARELAPLDPEPVARLAVFLSAAGRHRDAALCFERAYRMGPVPSRASDAARAWALAGDEARARSWRGRAG